MNFTPSEGVYLLKDLYQCRNIASAERLIKDYVDTIGLDSTLSLLARAVVLNGEDSDYYKKQVNKLSKWYTQEDL